MSAVHVTRHPATGVWWVWKDDGDNIRLTHTELLDMVRQFNTLLAGANTS